MQKHFDPVIKNTTQINKMFKPIWEFTYKIVNGEEKNRVKVVNRDPDNLLVQWVPGGKTITEILKEMNKGCRSVLVYLDSSTYIRVIAIRRYLIDVFVFTRNSTQ